MVQNVINVTYQYEERLRRCQNVPKLSYGRRMLTEDGTPNRLFLMYLFFTLTILRLDFGLFFLITYHQPICVIFFLITYHQSLLSIHSSCSFIPVTLTILRLDFGLFFLITYHHHPLCCFFINLSPIPSFHSLFMFLHSCYTHHP